MCISALLPLVRIQNCQGVKTLVCMPFTRFFPFDRKIGHGSSGNILVALCARRSFSPPKLSIQSPLIVDVLCPLVHNLSYLWCINHGIGLGEDVTRYRQIAINDERQAEVTRV